MGIILASRSILSQQHFPAHKSLLNLGNTQYNYFKERLGNIRLKESEPEDSSSVISGGLVMRMRVFSEVTEDFSTWEHSSPHGFLL